MSFRIYKWCIHIMRYLILASIIFDSGVSFGQAKNVIQFTHLTTANGLSQSNITCILKDRYGYMWFGTQDGLNKYDGYKFKVYRNHPTDKKSIPYNNIRCMLEDHAGNLWIGTVGGGLALYDRDKDSFISISTPPKDEQPGSKIIKAIYEDKQHNLWIGSVSGINLLNVETRKLKSFYFKDHSIDNINCIYEDRNDNFWLGTLNGLNVWNRKANTFKHFNISNSADRGLSDNNINAITEDKSGNLWIGSVNGLSLFNQQTETFTVYNYKKDNEHGKKLRDNVVRAICNADDNKLWIGTEYALYLFDPIQKTFAIHQSSKDGRSLSSSSITTLLLDNQGILWVGTYAKGINKYDKYQFKFNLYKNFGTEANVNSNIITSFSEVPNGDVWIGTDGSGLYRWTPGTDKFIAYTPENKENYFASLTVLSMQLSHDKKYLWIGTYGKGLARINLTTGITTYYPMGNGVHELNNKSVYTILEDKAGNIWTGTNGGGVNILNPITNTFTRLVFKTGKNKNSANYIRCFYEDKQDNMWIGTVAYGAIKYNLTTSQYKVYNKINSNLGSDVVFAINGDAKNNIWLGTMGGGLAQYDTRHDNFKRFTESQGLANNIVDAIVEDKSGNIWISTGNGLSNLNTKTYSFKNYISESGLQSNEFSIGAGFRLSTGEMIFGGLEGFNIFMPGSLKDNPYIPPVVITDFQLFNKPVAITAGKPPLQQNINITKNITLSHKESVFTIEFAALNYTVPQQNRYAYMLEGFDKGWNYIGTERKTTYTNLDPGKYIFRVKASNNDGLWNKKGTTLQIIILPPFWKTTWAYFLYLVIILGLLYLVFKEIKSQEKLKSEVHYQKKLTAKTKELNQLKLNFFTNLSHELRTPLSLIIDPLRKMKNENITTVQARKYSSLVFNNANMLMNLVNQLLDFRKVETGNFKLEAHKLEAIALIKDIYQAFIVRAKERNIQYYLDLKIDYLEAWIDASKLEKILYNLISNAFKYTPDFGIVVVMISNGKIKLDNEEIQNAIEIHIKDSGLGIPDEMKDKIFDIFYQIKGNERFEKESSGIGLALTKELVLLHNGQIAVQDSENRGTNFIVKIPLGIEYFSSDDPLIAKAGQIIENALPAKKDLSTNRSYRHKEEQPSNKPIVLIVEDNHDLREYIADELRSNYHVEQAMNGLEGLQKAIELIPNIIISDIMMPEINGLELCDQLKSNEKTSHIPIILLTAKQTDENKIEGFNHGADEYISKPFNVTLLATRIYNILESHRKLREVLSLNGPAITDIDKEFLKKVVKIIEENLSYLNFDIDKLAIGLKMSRRQLYRKLSALTNQTVHDFITNTRLDHAAALLLSGEFTISEIGYKVGFSEPSNFSRSFTKKFGKSPKKYLSDHKISLLVP